MFETRVSNATVGYDAFPSHTFLNPSRQMSDVTPVLVRHPRCDGDHDIVALFVQNHEKVVPNDCKVDADTVSQDWDTESDANSAIITSIRKAENVSTASESLPLNEPNTSKIVWECPKKGVGGQTDGDAVLPPESKGHSTHNHLSSNSDSSGTRQFRITTNEPQYMCSEEDSEHNPTEGNLEQNQDESRPACESAVLACSFVAAAWASFHESFVRNERCSNSYVTNKDDQMTYSTESLPNLQRHGLDILSLLTFGIATSAIHHINRPHRNQDYHILGGITIGLIFGMYIYRDLKDAVLRVVPWTILTGLVVSLAVHDFSRVREGRLRLNSGAASLHR